MHRMKGKPKIPVNTYRHKENAGFALCFTLVSPPFLRVTLQKIQKRFDSSFLDSVRMGFRLCLSSLCSFYIYIIHYLSMFL